MSGAMGGSGSEEFLAPTPVGEDTFVTCTACDYAANVEAVRVPAPEPGDPTAHAMLAVLEYRKGDCTAAVPHFDKAGNLLDSQLDALHAYATCLAKLKRLDDAAAVLKRALALHPNDPQERHLLASIQIMAKKPQDAQTLQ